MLDLLKEAGLAFKEAPAGSWDFFHSGKGSSPKYHAFAFPLDPLLQGFFVRCILARLLVGGFRRAISLGGRLFAGKRFAL